MDKKITVTSPLLPDLQEFIPYLEDIWDRKWVTNNGFYHKELEKKLAEYLGVEFISLFTNGTLPLITALQEFLWNIYTAIGVLMVFNYRDQCAWHGNPSIV